MSDRYACYATARRAHERARHRQPGRAAYLYAQRNCMRRCMAALSRCACRPAARHAYARARQRQPKPRCVPIRTAPMHAPMHDSIRPERMLRSRTIRLRHAYERARQRQPVRDARLNTQRRCMQRYMAALGRCTCRATAKHLRAVATTRSVHAARLYAQRDCMPQCMEALDRRA
jgi:hypothetical protein